MVANRGTVDNGFRRDPGAQTHHIEMVVSVHIGDWVNNFIHESVKS